MTPPARFATALDRGISGVTLIVAWLMLLCLMTVAGLRVVGRHLYAVDSEALRELEAAFFFTLVMLSFGHAYLRDGHVRVDILRERMSKHRIAWIELFGDLVILFPLSGLLVLYGGEAAWLSFRQGERVGSLDLPVEWVLKFTVPFGFLLLLLSAASVALRNVLFLRGQEEAPAPRGEDGSSVGADHGADET